MSKSKIPVYLLNLDRSSLRLRAAQIQLLKHDVEFERVPAIDGLGLKTSDFPEYDDLKANKYYGRSMTSGEIGCYLSHIKALRNFLGSEEKYCVILEDDFRVTPAGWDIVNEIVNLSSAGIVPSWTLGNLTKKPRMLYKPIADIHTHDITTKLYKAYYFPTLATANIWSRIGAKNFLTNGAQPICPVDHMFRKFVSNNGPGLALSKQAFIHPAGGSDIRSANPQWQKPAKVGRYRFKEIARQSRCIVSSALNFVQS